MLEIIEVLEGVKIASRQGEFLEKLTVVSESTVTGIAKEGLETVDE
ncbi:hypothetical protein [Wolbachia pipientis]|nr:hypothetical protein [Wolbachia pipientis]